MYFCGVKKECIATSIMRGLVRKMAGIRWLKIKY